MQKEDERLQPSHSRRKSPNRQALDCLFGAATLCLQTGSQNLGRAINPEPLRSVSSVSSLRRGVISSLLQNVLRLDKDPTVRHVV